MQLKRPGYRVNPVVDMFLPMVSNLSGFVYMDSWDIVDYFELPRGRFEYIDRERSVIHIRANLKTTSLCRSG